MSYDETSQIKAQELRKKRYIKYFFLKIQYVINNFVFVDSPFIKRCAKCGFIEIAHYNPDYQFDMDYYPCTRFRELKHKRKGVFNGK